MTLYTTYLGRTVYQNERLTVASEADALDLGIISAPELRESDPEKTDLEKTTEKYNSLIRGPEPPAGTTSLRGLFEELEKRSNEAIAEIDPLVFETILEAVRYYGLIGRRALASYNYNNRDPSWPLRRLLWEIRDDYVPKVKEEAKDCALDIADLRRRRIGLYTTGNLGERRATFSLAGLAISDKGIARAVTVDNQLNRKVIENPDGVFFARDPRLSSRRP